MSLSKVSLLSFIQSRLGYVSNCNYHINQECENIEKIDLEKIKKSCEAGIHNFTEIINAVNSKLKSK